MKNKSDEKKTSSLLTKQYLYNKQSPNTLRCISLLSVEHYVKILR